MCGYREAMREFASMSNLDVWYSHLDMAGIAQRSGPRSEAQAGQDVREDCWPRPSTKDSSALAKLTAEIDGERRIISDPPTIVPVEELYADVQADAISEEIRASGQYRRPCSRTGATCSASSQLQHVARKVVGVGSVGTRAWIALLDAADGVEPLVLQAKEAKPSVLAEFAGRSQYSNEGERVVAGQHLMQAPSDIFLGWTRVTGPDGVDRDFYVRQLRDWKFSVPIELMRPEGMTLLRRAVRVDSGPGPRPLRRPHRPGRLPRRLGQVRPGHRRLRRNLRRPECARPPGAG